MTTGRAYGVFKSHCSDGGIRRALKKAMPDWKPWPESLIESRTRYCIRELADVKQWAAMILGEDRAMLPVAQEWKAMGANWFIRITMADAVNENTADALQSVMGRLYSRKIIEQVGDAGAALYFREDGGAYICRILEGKK